MEEFKNLQETKLTSQPIFDGDVLHIYKDTVRLPNGKTSTREYTVHHGAVCILPLLENGDTEQYVAVNGRSFLIRRGEEVEVPECVAEVLRLSEKQKREAYRYQQEAIRRSMQGGDM